VRGRHDNSGRAIESGLGLGLNSSRRIVSKMGGDLKLVDGPLPGACFRLTLPLMRGRTAHDLVWASG